MRRGAGSAWGNTVYSALEVLRLPSPPFGLYNEFMDSAFAARLHPRHDRTRPNNSVFNCRIIGILLVRRRNPNPENHIMKKTILIVIAVCLLGLLVQPRIAAQSDNDQYVSVSGDLNVGTKLYDKNTHQFFGIVKDITWGKVEVLTASSAGVDGDKFSAATQTFSRSEITSNYVTKR